MSMLTFVKFERAGNDADGNLMAEFTASDGMQYQFALSPETFMNLFAGVWIAAGRLSPQSTQEGVGTALPVSSASFAVANMQPCVALMSGPLTFLVPLGATALQALAGEAQRYEHQQKSSRPQ